MPSIDIETAAGRREAFKRMLLVREFESRVGDLFAEGEIPGFVHLSIGQEAVAVGACGTLEPTDYATSTHRGHGHCIAKGMDPGRTLAELYGAEAGYCSGKGGSMHLADIETGMVGAQPIVGASAPFATGAGLTAARSCDDRIALAFIGDGAMAAGQVHESINLGATWSLPVIYLVENNRYSEGMTFEKQHNVKDLVDTAAAYGIEGVSVDGQDVEAVADVVGAAREKAVAGEGPTLVEANTYRFRGHYEGDSEPYRSEEEVSEWRQHRDPIENYADRLSERGDLSTDERRSIEARVAEIMDDAVAFARKADRPAPVAAYEHVFAESAPDVEYHRHRLAADPEAEGFSW